MYPSQVAAERLLLIDTSGDYHLELSERIEGLGYQVRSVDSIERALPFLLRSAVYPTVIVVACDRQGRMRAARDEVIAGIQAIGRASSNSQVILMVDSSVDLSFCCQAIKGGVVGFLEIEDGQIKPQGLTKQLEQARCRYELALADAKKLHSNQVFETTGIVGCSRAMAQLLSKAARAAEVSDAPVLIYGESGTGKQLLAEMIHRLDPKRCNRPFLSVNCAAIAGTLAESALFGHVKGAFTGATDARMGYFRSADGGTMFLDEIGDLNLELQPKLLRVLQEGFVLPVGSDKEFAVDIRVVAAANRRIPALVEAGEFRLDLYQRLNVIPLDIPPLRERREDIPLLVDFFVKKYVKQYDKPTTRVEPRVYEFLSQCALNGNVRELENVIRRTLAMKTDGDEIQLADLPEALLAKYAARESNKLTPLSDDIVSNACRLILDGVMTLPEFISECERLVLAHVIDETGHSHADLSKRLGMSSRTLYNKRNKHKL